MISKNSFPDHCIEQFEQWVEKFSNRKYKLCNKKSDKHIKLCKEILYKNIWESENENNIAYITGVLFKGLKEFIQLAELTRDQKWHLDNKRTEKVWGLMWNCIDRFRFCSPYIVSGDFLWIQETLEKLNDDFVKHFGYGLYSSPEIMIKKEICSICKKDPRCCLHINGNLYNGSMCYIIPTEMDLRSISLVAVPRDPRCRLWPWNMTEEMTFTAAIMVLFRIDDWLTEDLI
jgi:hypothetical protein